MNWFPIFKGFPFYHGNQLTKMQSLGIWGGLFAPRWSPLGDWEGRISPAIDPWTSRSAPLPSETPWKRIDKHEANPVSKPALALRRVFVHSNLSAIVYLVFIPYGSKDLGLCRTKLFLTKTHVQILFQLRWFPTCSFVKPLFFLHIWKKPSMTVVNFFFM